MEAETWSSAVDPDLPSPARVYDYLLGGSHNFVSDRRMAQQLERAMPDIGDIMRPNRSFLRRAVRYLTSVGVRHARCRARSTGGTDPVCR
jgi:hypothetical protein